MLVRATQLATALVALCVSDAANAQMSIYSYAFRKQYESTVTRDEIVATPEWKAEDENPPLSARKAIKAATTMKDSLVKDDDRIRWDFHSAELKHWDDRWYWIIAHRARPRVGGSSGPPTELRIVVLMDGTAVKPKISPWPPEEDDEPIE